jgi:hypothetical protein
MKIELVERGHDLDLEVFTVNIVRCVTNQLIE